MDDPFLTFRIAFFPFWRVVTTTASIIVGLLLVAARFLLNLPIDIPQIAVSLVCAVVSALVIVIALGYFPIYLYGDGIRCSDAMNHYHRIRWESIQRVRPFNLLGLRYVLINSHDSRSTLWLPLFLKDMGRFRLAVSEFAGYDNLLAAWLREKGY